MELTLRPGLLYEFAFVDVAPSTDALTTYLGPLAGEAKGAGAEDVAMLDITHIEQGISTVKRLRLSAGRPQNHMPRFIAGNHGQQRC